MSLFFYMKSEDGPIEIEITGDGAMVFNDYDIEVDIIAAELGDDPSEMIRLLDNWTNMPVVTLVDMYAASGAKKKYIYAKIARSWIFSMIDFINDNNCVLKNTALGYERERRYRLYTNKIKNAINSSISLVEHDNSYYRGYGKDSLFSDILYTDDDTINVSPIIDLYRRIIEDRNPYLISNLITIYNEAIRKIKVFCAPLRSEDRIALIEQEYMISAIKIIEEDQ